MKQMEGVLPMRGALTTVHGPAPPRAGIGLPPLQGDIFVAAFTPGP